MTTLHYIWKLGGHVSEVSDVLREQNLVEPYYWRGRQGWRLTLAAELDLLQKMASINLVSKLMTFSYRHGPRYELKWPRVSHLGRRRWVCIDVDPIRFDPYEEVRQWMMQKETVVFRQLLYIWVEDQHAVEFKLLFC